MIGRIGTLNSPAAFPKPPETRPESEGASVSSTTERLYTEAVGPTLPSSGVQGLTSNVRTANLLEIRNSARETLEKLNLKNGLSSQNNYTSREAGDNSGKKNGMQIVVEHDLKSSVSNLNKQAMNTKGYGDQYEFDTKILQTYAKLFREMTTRFLKHTGKDPYLTVS